jgi:predicted transcriptional regulator YheO
MTKKDLEPFFPLVDAIAETFGRNCEVVLHDFSKPEHSIVKIANGHVTGRDTGGPATGLILSLVGKKTKKESIVAYRTKSKDGADLKSTTIFIKDRQDKVIGSLCININITPYISIKNVIDELSFISEASNEETKESPEKFGNDVNCLINELVEQSIRKIGKPVAYMRKEDKLQIIRTLKENGLFFVKGAAKMVSNDLNVSLASVYKYLEEIK